MTAPALALAGLALLTVPNRVAATVRLRAVLPPADPRTADRGGRWAAGRRWLPRAGSRGSVVLAVGGGLAVGAAAGGPVVAVAGAVAFGAVSLLVRHARAASRQGRELDAAVEALATISAELRAGRTPADALRTAAAAVAADPAAPDGGTPRPGPPASAGAPAVAGSLVVAAATAAVGGDVPAALRHTAGAGSPDVVALLGRVAAGWQVSARSGVSLAAVLALVERDARARTRHRRQVAAELAGPRATAALLAVLPCVGLVLGTAMGARPLATLLHTGAGRLALLAGVLLDVAGAAWTLRLVGTGARP